MEKQEYFDLVKHLKKELLRHKFIHRRDLVTQCSCGWEYEDLVGKYSKARKFADHVSIHLAQAHMAAIA